MFDGWVNQKAENINKDSMTKVDKMIQEYLIENKQEIEYEYKDNKLFKVAFQSIKKQVSDDTDENAKNNEIWIVSFSTKNEGEKDAKVLSDLNESIVSKYTVIALRNESAAYFNRRLYPIINEFERRLRTLLYLQTRLGSDEEAKNIIKDLEGMDFGGLFEILFHDENFFIEARKYINLKDKTFTKRRILKEIGEMKENMLWTRLFGEELPKLQQNFEQVRLYRNDIMHAHNINYQTYRSAKDLLESLNAEIQGYIDKLMGRNSNVSIEFSRSLAEALKQSADSIVLPDDPLKGPMVALTVFDQALEGYDTTKIRKNLANGLRRFADDIAENE